MTIETTTKITVDMLTKNSVSILSQTFAVVNDTEVQVGENFRRAYMNSTSGRAQVADEIGEPYTTAILAVWGDTPTVEEEPV